jgi:ribosomal protein L1
VKAKSVKRAAAAKGKYFRTVSVSSTMGPGIEIDPASIEAL